MKQRTSVVPLVLAMAFILLLVFAANRDDDAQAVDSTATGVTAKAMLAGGCFWCMEHPFEKIDGVHSVTSGYAGGTSKDPTYHTYARSGHIEVVEILYDPQKVSYQFLLETFWRQINPTDAGGQFVDRGHEYSSAIFYYDDEQKRLAEESKQALADSKRFSEPIVTPILPAPEFFQAEAYHQDYYKKKPVRYKFYRSGSGRDDFLQRAWKGAEEVKVDPGADLKTRLTPLQYHVTQEDGTEPPFQNKYWDTKDAGIYVDIVSGEPLFSSLDKYDSGTGWPSFSQPLVKENVVENMQLNFLMQIVEVRSLKADSHLGHVFDDGPQPTGLRYCINSAALRFIPADQLEAKGYTQFASLFK